MKLIDEVGGEREAIAWLERSRGIAKDLPIRDYRRRSGLEELGLTGSVAGGRAGSGSTAPPTSPTASPAGGAAFA